MNRKKWLASAGAGALLIAGAAAVPYAGMAGQDDSAGDGKEPVQSGAIDDGRELLSQADISIDEAIDAARQAESGGIGEIGLEHYNGTLVFNVAVGDHDVKVDAHDSTVRGSTTDG